MRGLQATLQWVPWPIMLVLIGVVALRAGGRSLALFAVATLLYVLIAGYWRQSMNTLALVLLAVPMSVAAGFGLGVLAYRKPRLRGAIEVALDLMQTMPGLCLPYSVIVVVRLRSGGRADRQRDLRNSTDGAEYVSRAWSAYRATSRNPD